MTLREEIENAEKALDNMKSMHKAVIAELGLKTAIVGDLLKEEKKLENEIEELKKKYDKQKQKDTSK